MAIIVPSRSARQSTVPKPLPTMSLSVPADCGARAFIVLMVCVSSWGSPAFAQSIPSDAEPTDAVPPTTFASWFESGMPSENGRVNPANSITFPNNSNAAFYRWSEQMFLWVTSPSAAGDGPVFASSTFYDVSAPDAQHRRTLIPHTGLQRPSLNLRAAKPGPNGLPVILSKTGTLFEVVPPVLDTDGTQLILNAAGKPVPIGKSGLNNFGKPVFFDKLGNQIVDARPDISPELAKSQVVQKFMIGKQAFFLDALGNVVETDVGEATTHGVLLTQHSELVYYGIAVNDVYAYFLTGTVDGGITPTTQFPTTQAELTKIVDFASQHNKSFSDPKALTVEIKTAWVESKSVQPKDSYIRIMGTVPTFDKTDSMNWKPIPNGEKTVELALIGIHIVGSAQGHPEMIWATFEHFGNAPNGAYTYNSIAGPNPKTVAQNTSGAWLFCANGATGGPTPYDQFNVALQKVDTGDIVAQSLGPSLPARPIGPSNTLRSKAFGSAVRLNPPFQPSASNTEIISMNNSVRSQLIGNDIRKNYFLVGATWTIGGTAPFPPDDSSNPQTGNAVGTNQLSNTTMETFQQGPDNQFGKSFNCFACHNIKNATTTTQASTGISHIFGQLKPLF